MKDKISAELLIRYFSGDCNQSEERVVERWLNDSPENARRAQVWLDFEEVSDSRVVDEVLMSRNDVWDNLSPSLDPSKGKRSWGVISMATAAALAGLAILAFGYLYTAPDKFQSQMVVTKTAFGQTRKILLPDSSVVILNGNSQLRYSATLGTNDREVWLEGEAFFDVRHQLNDSRFLVNISNQKTIEVLGTEFNVSDRTGESCIVLQSGSIKLDLPDGRPAIFLKPGDFVKTISLDGQTEKIETKVVDPEAYSVWTAGTWRLESTSLGEMLQKLRETYGIKIQVMNQELLEKQVSGSIPLPTTNDNIYILIDDILDLFQLKSSKEEGVYYLSEDKE